jgi:hypothetical protein
MKIMVLDRAPDITGSDFYVLVNLFYDIGGGGGKVFTSELYSALIISTAQPSKLAQD